jgi:hypothetical protein
MAKDPKELVKQLAQQVGKHEARRLLVEEGVSTSTAEKLVGARYKNEVGLLIKDAVLRALESAKRIAS